MFILQLNLKNFGRFHDQTIYLENNINIIEGLNETGKTTIFNFIIGMFYGFVKPYIKTLRFEPEYYKYYPWESDQYNGSLIFFYEENTYRLNRDFKNRTYEIYNENTGENIIDQLEGYELSNLAFPGEYFFKISASVFRNTLFMHSLSTDIEAKTIREIGDCLSLTNQEAGMYSYEYAYDYLESKKEAIGTKRAFKKPYGQLVSSREKLEANLKKNVVNKNAYYQHLEHIGFLRKRLKNLEENKISVERKKKLAIKEHTKKAYIERNLLQEEYQQIEKKIKTYNIYQKINPKEIEHLKDMHHSLNIVREELSGLTKIKKQAFLDKKQIEDVLENKEQLMDAKVKYNSLKHQIIGEENQISRLDKKIILTVLLGVGITAIFVLLEIYFPILFLLLLVVLFTIYFKYNKHIHQMIIEEDKNELQNVFDMTKEKYRLDLSNNLEEAEMFMHPTAEEIERKSFLEDHLRKIDHRIDFLIDEEENISYQIEDEIIMLRKDHNIDLSKYDEVVGELSMLKERKRSVEDHIRRYDKEYDFSILHENIAEERITQFIEFEDPEEIDFKIKECISELSAYEEKANQLEETVHQVAENEEMLAQIQVEIQKMDEDKQAIDIALEALQSANQKLHANYLPILNEELNQYLPIITGSRRNYVVDGNLNVSMLSERVGDFKTKEYFSQGTKDQVFVMLRLAIIKQILGENYLLILDDALAQYDDERLERQLQLLSKIAENKQILIFTCHKRENEIITELGLENHYVRLE